jgi:hypothetical protein
MGQLKDEIVEVFLNVRYLFSFLGLFIFIFFLFTYFTDDELIIGNLGYTYYYFELITLFFIAFFFASFLILSIYKINYFNKFSIKESGKGGFGALLGIIVVGCPACSITLASYIGLAGFFAGFPLFGLEFKFIAILILIYSNYSILKSLKSCRIKRKK